MAESIVDFKIISGIEIRNYPIHSKWKWPGRIAFYSLVVLLMAFSVRLSYLYTSLPGPCDGPDWRWNWEKYDWILSHLI